MTMVELVGNDAHTAKLEGLATTVDDGSVALYEAVEAGVTTPRLAEVRDAAARLLADPTVGRDTAAQLVAEILRLVDRFGIRAAARVDDRVVLAVTTPSASEAAPAAAPRRAGWAPAERCDWDVSVTQFGRVPGPYVSGLSEGRPFSLSKRADKILEVHPLTDAEARRVGLYDDPTLDPEPLALSKLMDNPSGVLRRAQESPDRMALLTRNNVVIGLVVPTKHPAVAGERPTRPTL